MRIRDKIYQLVKRRPRTVDELLAEIWWLHPQDAPGREAIKAHVWLLNQGLTGEVIINDGAYRLARCRPPPSRWTLWRRRR